MDISASHWFPVIGSRELGSKPLAKTRFGQKLVFWRDSAGNPVCMPDRCPHRGAALSLGRINGDAIACPFHGFEYSRDGHCSRMPPEGERPIPDGFGLESYPLTEAAGYVWLWRGASVPADQRPEPPRHPWVENMAYGESISVWPAHYTRCIENVCDYSHLAFVHRTTIGLFRGETQTDVEVEEVDHGFRAHLIEDGRERQTLEFLYPNLWLLKVSRSFLMTAVFTPIDATTTEVYGRTWYSKSFPGARFLMDVYSRFSQFLVFREDWPIVASQDPVDVGDVDNEKLVPSDAPVIAYRKLHNAHRSIWSARTGL